MTVCSAQRKQHSNCLKDMHTNLFLNADIFSQAGRFKWMKIKYKTTQLQCGGLVASDLLTLQKSCADLYMHL